MRIIKLFILNTILFRGLEGSGSKIQKELIEKKRGRIDHKNKKWKSNGTRLQNVDYSKRVDIIYQIIAQIMNMGE
jgi:hypothetical protein